MPTDYEAGHGAKIRNYVNRARAPKPQPELTREQQLLKMDESERGRLVKMPRLQFLENKPAWDK